MKNLFYAFVILAGLMFACQSSPKQEPTKLTGQQQAVDTTQAPQGKPIPAAWKKLSNKVGEYMYDTIFLATPAVHDSLERILPKAAFDDMMLNWDVASDLKRFNNLLVANGCKHENCFSDMWIVVIDMAHDAVNAYNIRDRKLYVYTGSRQINLPEGLQQYITKMKRNGNVPDNAVEIVN